MGSTSDKRNQISLKTVVLQQKCSAYAYRYSDRRWRLPGVECRNSRGRQTALWAYGFADALGSGIRDAIGQRKMVPIDSEIIESAREIGISFGN